MHTIEDEPEVWKPVPNRIYDASSLGRIRNRNTGRIVGTSKNGAGYYILPGLLVHRLVAAAWCGLDIDDSTTTVDHIDGDKANNRPSNLQLLSRRDHAAKALSAGAVHSRSGPVRPLPTNAEDVLDQVERGELTVEKAAFMLSRSRTWVGTRVARLRSPQVEDVQGDEWRSCREDPSIEFNKSGVCRSTLTKREQTPGIGGGGYKKVRNVYVHRAVMHLFGPPQPHPGALVRHYPDPDKGNNAITNLRWGTYQENGDDTVEQGNTRKGSKHPATAMSETCIQEGLEKLIAEDWSTQQLADFIGCTQVAAENIVSGRAWKHVPRPENFDALRMRREGATHHLTHLNEEALSAAFQLAGKNKWTAAQFAEHLDISIATARQIFQGVTWRSVPRPPELLEHLKKQSQSNARMSDDLVKEILAKAKETGWGAPRLAKHFGKSTATLSSILAGTSYTHVPR